MQQKTAKCKQCKTKHSDVAKMVTTPSALGKFCDYDCVADWVRDNPVKIKQLNTKAYNDETKKLKSSSLSYQAKSERKTRERAAKEACHDYIRARDKGKPCPCCGMELGDDYHAGHFKRSNSFGAIKYHEDNIHGQRADCNTHYGGDRGQYEHNLRKRIGDDRVNALYAKITNKSRVYKYTIDELKEIERYYKDKLKQLIDEVTE